MSLPSSVDLDPAVRKFCERVTEGGAAVPDGIAGLLLRLAGRVGALEAKSRDHDVKLDKLSKQPRLSVLEEKMLERKCLEQNAPMTGVDGGRNGASDGPERDSAPARPAPHSIGRPKGRPDSPRYAPRQRTGGIWSHREDLEIEVAHIVDHDWDAG
jgi:hypothetical protein